METLTLVLPIALLTEETGLSEATIRDLVHASPAHAFRTLVRFAAYERRRARDQGRLMVRDVACPLCSAPAGEPCVGSRGQGRAANHRERERAAKVADSV